MTEPFRASVKPWPRLFHNMRASCATDWVERFPAHVVAGWLGHSPLIAARHYLQTRDVHFDMATAGVATPVASETDDQKSGAKRGAPEAQNAAQHPMALVRPNHRKSLVLQRFFKPTRTNAKRLQSVQVGDPRLELGTSCVSCMRASQLRQSPRLAACPRSSHPQSEYRPIGRWLSSGRTSGCTDDQT